VPLLVWAINFDLSGKRDPTNSKLPPAYLLGFFGHSSPNTTTKWRHFQWGKWMPREAFCVHLAATNRRVTICLTKNTINQTTVNIWSNFE
jgi:hypothetical protein